MMTDRVLISKATGIPPHVLLLGNMQKVIDSQHMFLQEMKKAINEEFDKHHMASDSFKAKNQLTKTLTSFEERLLRTFELPLGGFDEKAIKLTYEVPGGGIWFQWGGRFNRVP